MNLRKNRYLLPVREIEVEEETGEKTIENRQNSDGTTTKVEVSVMKKTKRLVFNLAYRDYKTTTEAVCSMKDLTPAVNEQMKIFAEACPPKNDEDVEQLSQIMLEWYQSLYLVQVHSLTKNGDLKALEPPNFLNNIEAGTYFREFFKSKITYEDKLLERHPDKLKFAKAVARLNPVLKTNGLGMQLKCLNGWRHVINNIRHCAGDETNKLVTNGQCLFLYSAATGRTGKSYIISKFSDYITKKFGNSAVTRASWDCTYTPPEFSTALLGVVSEATHVMMTDTMNDVLDYVPYNVNEKNVKKYVRQAKCTLIMASNKLPKDSNMGRFNVVEYDPQAPYYLWTEEQKQSLTLTNERYEKLFDTLFETAPDEDYCFKDIKTMTDEFTGSETDRRIWEALTEDEVYLEIEEAYKIHKFISRHWLSNICSNTKYLQNYDLSVYEAFLNNCKNNGLLSVVNNKRLRLNKKFMEKLSFLRATDDNVEFEETDPVEESLKAWKKLIERIENGDKPTPGNDNDNSPKTPSGDETTNTLETAETKEETSLDAQTNTNNNDERCQEGDEDDFFKSVNEEEATTTNSVKTSSKRHSESCNVSNSPSEVSEVLNAFIETEDESEDEEYSAINEDSDDPSAGEVSRDSRREQQTDISGRPSQSDEVYELKDLCDSCKTVNEFNTIDYDPSSEYITAAKFHDHIRKSEYATPTALVYEADHLPMEEQLKTMEAKKTDDRVISATYSGGKSIHFLVPIDPKNIMSLKDIEDRKDFYKFCWREVGKRIFGSVDDFDKACASIGRLTRNPGAIRSNNGKEQTSYYKKKVKPISLDREFSAWKNERTMRQLQQEAARQASFLNKNDDKGKRYLENIFDKNHNEHAALALQALNGCRIPSGANMIGCLGYLKKIDIDRDVYQAVAREFNCQHPSNIGNKWVR